MYRSTHLKSISTTALTAIALSFAPMAAYAQAIPLASLNDWVSQDGFTSSATIDNMTTTIDTVAPIAVGETLNANVHANTTVNINMTNNSDFFVFKDVSGDGMVSRIDGTVNATRGSVIMIDPDGSIIGSDGVINTFGFSMFPGDPNLADFKSDLEINHIELANLTGDITIESGAQVTLGRGLNAFIGNKVINHGNIVTTTARTIHLAAGKTATLDLYGDGLVEIAVTSGDITSNITNTGTIDASASADSEIYMTARRAGTAINNVINMKGTTAAQSVSVDANGTIILDGNTINAVTASIKAPKLVIKNDVTVSNTNTSLTLDAHKLNMYARIEKTSGDLLDHSDVTTTALITNVKDNDDNIISQAMDFTNDGGTVNIDGLVYNEDLLVSRALTLTGHPKGLRFQPRLNGNITIKSGDVTIENMNIRGSNDHGITILTNQNNINILDNTIAGHDGHGIYMIYSKGGTNTIAGNWIKNNGRNGIHMEYLGGNDETIISQNLINNNGENGIFARAFHNLTLDDNIITGHKNGSGIRAYWFNLLEASNNIATNNSKAGFYLSGFKDAVIGVAAKTRNQLIRVNNIISGNGHGVLADNFGSMTINSAHIINNKDDGVELRNFNTLRSSDALVSGHKLNGYDLEYFYQAILGDTSQDNVGNRILKNKNGIRAEHFSNMELNKNIISNHRQNGIDITEFSNLQMNNNIVSNNKNAGLITSFFDTATLIGNIFSNNEYGVYAYGFEEMNAEGNLLSNNKNSGISLTGFATLNANNNILSKNKLNAIRVENFETANITSNLFYKNDFGLNMTDFTSANIEGNIFASNLVAIDTDNLGATTIGTNLFLFNGTDVQ